MPASFIYGESSFLPKTFLILPEMSNVKLKWLLTPDTKNKSQGISSGKIHFFIDFKNEPVLVYEKKILFNPVTGYMVKLKQTIKDMVCLDNGVLLFSDGANIGYLESKKESDPIPSASIKAVAKLPLPDSMLHKGDNSIYASGLNKKTKKYEVYLFNNSKKLFQKVASFIEPLNAISGKGEHIFFAKGRQINEYKNGKTTVIYEHPKQEIRELFYNEKVGLIYKTANGVGLIRDNSALEFLQTENPVVFLKGTSLYVFFSSVSGVLEIMNIDDLKNYSFKVEKIIDIQQTF